MRDRVLFQSLRSGENLQLLIAGERGSGKSSYVNGLTTISEPATETRIKNPATVFDNCTSGVTEQVILIYISIIFIT